MKNRKMPPHIVLPNGQWRFVKKGRGSSVSVKHRKVVSLAKGKKKRYGGGRKGLGGMMSLLAPVVGGAGDVIIQKYIPIFGIGSTVSGFVFKDQVTMKIGLNKIGESLGAMFDGGGAGNSGGL